MPRTTPRRSSNAADVVILASASSAAAASTSVRSSCSADDQYPQCQGYRTEADAGGQGQTQPKPVEHAVTCDRPGLWIAVHRTHHAAAAAAPSGLRPSVLRVAT
jgi:hypothetical protein